MRHEDWPRRLQAFVRERRRMPFAWGSNDCATLAADWVLEATGTDPMYGMRGGWSDARQAMARIAELGGLRQATTDRLGPEILPSLAQRGDVVLIVVGDRETLAVCVGEHALGASDAGALLAPMADAVAAWRVA